MTRTAPGRTGLSESLSTLLLEARELEVGATGADRLPAFRTSRILIGALLDAGFSAAAIASCLGITTGSVRDRAERDGVLRWSTIRSLTALADAGQLTSVVPLASPQRGEPVFRALELVRALDSPLDGGLEVTSADLAHGDARPRRSRVRYATLWGRALHPVDEPSACGPSSLASLA